MLTIEQIQTILPHRYPFLLVDRIVELVPGERAVGVKNVTANEEFFQGHFPRHPVMPGVLVLESMAQVGGVLVLSMDENKGKLAYFGGVDKVRFRRPVVPGDQLVTEATVIQNKGDVGRIRIVGKVGDEVAAEGECLFVLRPAPV
jgi:3-hydroxyacyl-[acyl-carrier-protein] dehydratase